MEYNSVDEELNYNGRRNNNAQFDSDYSFENKSLILENKTSSIINGLEFINHIWLSIRNKIKNFSQFFS